MLTSVILQCYRVTVFLVSHTTVWNFNLYICFCFINVSTTITVFDPLKLLTHVGFSEDFLHIERGKNLEKNCHK